MFSDSVTTDVICPSQVNAARSFKEITIQTDAYKIIHRGVQVGKQKAAQCQTTANEEVEVNEKYNNDESSSPQLLKFLRKAETLIVKQLYKNSRSKVFNNAETRFDNSVTVEKKVCLFVKDAREYPFSITGMSWNCTGCTLAVAHGMIDHESWCLHNGFVALWNLSRDNVNAEVPDSRLDCTGCVMSVKFHPAIPSLLAVGTFSGDLILYSLAKDSDNLVATAGCTEGGHTESVNDIEWLCNPTDHCARVQLTTEGDRQRMTTIRLLTVGGDGRIICWSLEMVHTPCKLKCTKIFQVRNTDQPVLKKPKYVGMSGVKISVDSTITHGEHAVSLTTSTLSPHQTDLMVVGTDSGGVLLCNLDKFCPTEPTEATIRHPSPVEFALSRQSGPIQTLDWSRCHRNLLLSCGSGAVVQVHNTLRSDQSVNLDLGQGNVLAAFFHPNHPNILLCTTENSALCVFDLLGGSGTNSESVDESQVWNGPALLNSAIASIDTTKRAPSPMITLSCNSKDPDVVATGDVDGRIWIWTIKSLPHMPAAQVELQIMNRLFKETSMNETD